MKKRIAILGSTGSIGKTLLKILSRHKKEIEIVLLTANKNYKELINQSNKFNVKNVIITNNSSYIKFKNKNKNKKIKIYNNFSFFNQIFKTKIDYTMSSIVGLDGLSPTIKIIKHTKKIAVANKESIICGWNIINKNLKRYQTEFIPVDSEHFSIWYALKNNFNTNIDKIYLTASGGSLLNIPSYKFNHLDIEQILRHPNWKMGKKITIDSSTMINKVFEIIEAKNLFNLNYNQLDIIIHPKSYIHAILKFSDGMIKIIAHDTTMEIPIFNSIYLNNKQNIKTNKINFQKLNNLNLTKVDKKKFPSVKILKNLPKNSSLYETALVSANDKLVSLFLEDKIKYNEIIPKLFKIMNRKDIRKLKKILPTKVSEVINTSINVRSKISSLNTYN